MSHSYNTPVNSLAMASHNGRLMTRMRGVENTTSRNALWNIVEADDDENDVGMGRAESPPRYPSASSMIQNAIMKPRGVTMIKKGRQLYPAKLVFPAKVGSPTANASGLRRDTSNPKYSYKLRNMLESDLKIVGMNPSTATRTSTRSDQKRPAGLTTSLSATSNHRTKIRKTSHSLREEFSQDMQSLLKTLHSNEFAGTIDPRYHSRYVSDESLRKQQE